MKEFFIEKLQASWEDEKRDIEKYREMANNAERVGRYETAGVLRDIANDEESHAAALCNLLTEAKKW